MKVSTLIWPWLYVLDFAKIAKFRYTCITCMLNEIYVYRAALLQGYNKIKYIIDVIMKAIMTVCALELYT